MRESSKLQRRKSRSSMQNWYHIKTYIKHKFFLFVNSSHTSFSFAATFAFIWKSSLLFSSFFYQFFCVLEGFLILHYFTNPYQQIYCFYMFENCVKHRNITVWNIQITSQAKWLNKATLTKCSHKFCKQVKKLELNCSEKQCKVPLVSLFGTTWAECISTYLTTFSQVRPGKIHRCWTHQLLQLQNKKCLV